MSTRVQARRPRPLTSADVQSDRNAAALVQLGVTVRIARSLAEDHVKAIRREDRRVKALARKFDVLEELERQVRELT